MSRGILLGAAGAWIGTPTDVYTPTGIDDTGATNVSSALQTWLDTVPDGTVLVPTVIWLEGAWTFKVDDMWQWIDRHDIVVRGHGVQFIVESIGDRDRANLWFERCDRIYLEDVHTTGIAQGHWDTLYEAQHGFTWQGCTFVTMIDCGSDSQRGDFINIAGGSYVATDDVIVRGFVGNHCDRQGMSITGGNRILIEQSWIMNASRAYLDLEPGGDGRDIFDVTYQDNIIIGAGLFFVSSAGGSFVNNILIARNVLQAHAMTIYVNNESVPRKRRANWTVIDNTSNFAFGKGPDQNLPSGPPDPGGWTMLFWGVDGVTVLRNEQPMQVGRDMYLVKDRSCTAVNVADNDCLRALGERMP